MATSPYQQLWRVVDGAVIDCFKNHPDYLTRKGRATARHSLVKRVTGTVLSFAVQHTARGRVQAANTAEGASLLSTPETTGSALSVVTLSPLTQPSAWVHKGYNRYRFAQSFATMCASLQRGIEVDRACYRAVRKVLS